MTPTVTIKPYTTKNPITMIGEMAGCCWGADTTNSENNYKRGIDCLNNRHGRTFEFPDVYMSIDGYSARVIREFYTHIGGMPTRLQASTRYIDYQHGFDYVTPPEIKKSPEANGVYEYIMSTIQAGLKELDRLGIPREDSAMALPLGMTTTIVGKYNLRTLMDMSRQRMCSRAYHEFRKMFLDICSELKAYSDEWAYLIDHYFMPKCDEYGYCTEKKSCNRHPKRPERV